MVVLDKIGDGLANALLMAWETWWALVLGFFISAVVQAWVPRERIESALSGSGPASVARATGLGAASSSCSYAAVAIAKSLFQKGASASTALAFQFASTNLVWELGLVLWVLIGWQFTLAEYIGGIVMIVLMALLLRAFVSPRLEEHARAHARAADTGHQHHMAGEQLGWRQRLTSARAWSDVAHNFRGDWQMLYKEIATGFLLAGFVGLLGNGFFNALFIHDAPGSVRTIENVVVGPLVAVLSFVCSVGNVPLAAVLWSGGISFAGVLAFIFADLIVLPILAIYRKYYGWTFALRITALMLVTMIAAALIVDGLFGAAGLIPHARPSRGDIFGHLAVDYKLWLNVLGVVIFAALFGLTMRRGTTDPVCGMAVDREKALTLEHAGSTYYFCSEDCRAKFQADPDAYAGKRARPTEARVAVGGGTQGVKDVVCGMMVDPATATTGEHDRRRWFFCSPACNARFDADPERYASGGTPDGQVQDLVCGMAVDPATATTSRHHGRRVFFCSAGCRESFATDPERYLTRRVLVADARRDDGARER